MEDMKNINGVQPNNNESNSSILKSNNIYPKVASIDVNKSNNIQNTNNVAGQAIPKNDSIVKSVEPVYSFGNTKSNNNINNVVPNTNVGINNTPVQQPSTIVNNTNGLNVNKVPSQQPLVGNSVNQNNGIVDNKTIPVPNEVKVNTVLPQQPLPSNNTVNNNVLKPMSEVVNTGVNIDTITQPQPNITQNNNDTLKPISDKLDPIDNIMPIQQPLMDTFNEPSPKSDDKLNKPLRNKIDKEYILKVICFILIFSALFTSSFLLIRRFASANNGKNIKYTESGNLDYKVYLKANDFYENDYMNKGMYYVASLIKNVDVDFDYNFSIDEDVDMNLKYSIVGILRITDESEENTFFEKEYVLSDQKDATQNSKRDYSIKENLVVDYDYYNTIANNFRYAYGLNTASTLTLYLKVDKDIKVGGEALVDNNSDLSVKIPLSQKAIDIKIDDQGLNSTKSILRPKKLGIIDYASVVIAIALFIASVASLLKLLEVLSLLVPQKSKYEKYVSKLLREYDRLIIETPTTPKFGTKDIIEIKKVEELLDARQNLKMPIIYHKVSDNKCYFYVEKDEYIYLMTLNDSDFEN